MLTRWWVFLLALLMFGSGLEPGGRALAEDFPRFGFTTAVLWDGASPSRGDPRSVQVQLDEAPSGAIPAPAESPDRDLGQPWAEAGTDVPLVVPAMRYEPIAHSPGPWLHGPTDPLRRSPVLDGLLRPPSLLSTLA